MKIKIFFFATGIVLATLLSASAEDAPREAPVPVAAPEMGPVDKAFNRHILSEFGPYATIQQAQETLQKATKSLIEKSGGVIIIPPDAPIGFFPRNPVQEAFNKPAVTVIDQRGGVQRLYVPAFGASDSSGCQGGSLIIERDASGNFPWQGCYATENILTRCTGGSSSFLDIITRPVKKGKDARFYVVTHRGLFVGQNLRVTGEKRGYGGKDDWITVKALGLDGKDPYFVADALEDHPAEVLAYNKNVVNGLTITDVTNSDNQSMTMTVAKNHYGVGDAFVFSSSLNYQGNIMSAAGDEGGVCYAADIVQDPVVFSGEVESWDAKTLSLIYKPGAMAPQKIGTSRPIINMNQKKWITSGKLIVVGPGHSYLREKTDEVPIHQPLVIGMKDTKWDESVIGRFIAINEPSEYYDANETFSSGYAGAPGKRSYRWWHITGIKKRADGTTNLFVENTSWWTYDRSGITLLRINNDTTSEKNTKELSYIIAPGSWAVDVRFGVCGNVGNGNYGVATKNDMRKILLAPFPQMGTKADFAVDDPIIQPLGPQPSLPDGFRVRHHQGFPSRGLNGASFSGVNWGKVAVGAGLSLMGPGGKLEDVLKGQKDGNPSYMVGVDMLAATGTAMRVRGAVRDSAITLEQWDENLKPIRWYNPKGTSSFYARPATNDFVFEGGNLDLSGRTSIQQTGISQTATAAKNLRGINVSVPAGSKELKVAFERPEADGNYAIMISSSWITLYAVKDKTAAGFTVIFDTAAPEKGGSFDWFLVR